MKKRTTTKLIVQAVAVVFGLLGLIWIFGGFYLAVMGIVQSDHIPMFITPIVFLFFGGIALAIAWQNLRHFGRESIQNVAGLIAFWVYIGLMTLVSPLEPAFDRRLELLYPAILLILMFLVYLLYRVLSRKLIRLIETESSQEAESTVRSKATSDTSSDVQ